MTNLTIHNDYCSHFLSIRCAGLPNTCLIICETHDVSQFNNMNMYEYWAGILSYDTNAFYPWASYKIKPYLAEFFMDDNGYECSINTITMGFEEHKNLKKEFDWAKDFVFIRPTKTYDASSFDKEAYNAKGYVLHARVVEDFVDLVSDSDELRSVYFDERLEILDQCNILDEIRGLNPNLRMETAGLRYMLDAVTLLSGYEFDTNVEL